MRKLHSGFVARMTALVIYGLAVFALCFLSIGLLRQKLAAILVVLLWTLLSPLLMQLLNTLVIGYLDPFWEWSTFVLALIALGASTAALMAKAVLEQGEDSK